MGLQTAIKRFSNYFQTDDWGAFLRLRPFPHLPNEDTTMKDEKKKKESADLQRRSLLKNTAAATIGLGAMSGGLEARAEEVVQSRAQVHEIAQQAARPAVRESVKITRMGTFLVRRRWL